MGQRCVCSFDTHFKRRISLCYDEFDEVEVEKKITKEVMKQANLDYPRKSTTRITPTRKHSSKGTPNRVEDKQKHQTNNNSPGYKSTPDRKISNETNENSFLTPLKSQQLHEIENKKEEMELEKEINEERISINNDHLSQKIPTPSIPAPTAVYLMTPPRSRVNIHEVTPDRRRKEAIIKIKGKPITHPMSRWSIDKS